MTDKFIVVEGVKLFYTEKNEAAAYTIFFLHGNSSNRHTWAGLLDSPVLSDYRLVAFDLPAHGASDAIPAGYTLPRIARLMANAVQQLSANKPYILAGVSLGTNVIAEMLAFELQPKALLLAGPCIAGEKHTPDKFIIPDTRMWVSFVDEPAENDLMAILGSAMNHHTAQKDAAFLEDYRAVKDNFRSKLGQSIADGVFSDQVALIASKKIPALIIFGADDKLIYADYLDNTDMQLWKNSIIKLSGAGHLVHLDEPELLTGLLNELASQFFGKSA